MQREQLHILILPKWYPHAEDPQNGSFIAHYASELSKTHQVSVIFPVPVDKAASPEIKSSGNLLEIRVPYVQSMLTWSPIRKMINYYRYRNAIERGVDQLMAERETPDLIHAMVLIRPAIFARKFSRKWGIPWMLTEHSSEFLRENALSDFKINIISRIYRQTNRVVAVSNTLAKGLENITGLPSVSVIPNIIDFGNPALDQPNNDKIHMGIVADLVDEIKNVSGVLRALANVRSKLPSFSLQIVGEGIDYDALITLSHQLGLDDVAEFLGRKNHDAVLDFLPTIDFLITNSRSETFSIVTAEAISCGKPVIITKCGGPEEWFREDYGIMISPDAPSELEQALIRMCNGYQQYPPDRLAQSIRKQFDPDSVIQAYDKLYREMIKP